MAALAACGGQGETASSTGATTAGASSTAAPASSAAPAPSSSSSTPTPLPSPTGAIFIDAVDASLGSLAGLLQTEPSAADLAPVLSQFDADVPDIDLGSIAGVGVWAEQWQDVVTERQMIGLDAALGTDDLEAFGAGLPSTWNFNSISTTDTSATLVATRVDDGLRLEVASYVKPDKGGPKTEVRLSREVTAMPSPRWLATLPALEGGQVVNVAEGVGRVQVDYAPAGDGLVSARWRYDGDRIEEAVEYLLSGALEVAGFELLEPDAITVGATSFEVAAGDWAGQVIVGSSEFDGQTFTDLVWLLQKGLNP